MNTKTREFGSKAKDAAVAARVQRDYTPAAWAADMAANKALGKVTREQAEALVALAAQRTPWVSVDQVFLFAATNTPEVVGQRAAWLMQQPVAEVAEPVQAKPALTLPSPSSNVPEGRYAIGPVGETKFYQVDRPTEGKWAGYVFVKVQAGDDLHSLRNRQAREAVLAAIAAAGVEASMLRYGRELGHCGHCGRTLTNPESLERGIGPVCYGKMGF